jgi:hypothetical protein
MALAVLGVESSAGGSGSLMALAISKTKGTLGRGEGEAVGRQRHFTGAKEVREASRWKNSATVR